MYTFVSNKPFGSLLKISPKNYNFLKTFNSEFQEIKLWFTDQDSQALEIEHKINATKVAKKISKKYSQKHFDSAKKSTTDAIKTASKRAIQKTSEATAQQTFAGAQDVLKTS